MIKQQDQYELSELINISGIYQSMESLEHMLDNYQRLEKVRSHGYIVRIEIEKIKREIMHLKESMDSLIYESVAWNIEQV
jgi:hypothetical protein